MKVSIEIPDRYEKTNLYLMWGMVPVARWRWANQYWEVKTQHCAQCGKCCSELEGKRHPFRVIDGICEHLNKHNLCTLAGNRPFGCCVSDPVHLENCTIEWEPV